MNANPEIIAGGKLIVFNIICALYALERLTTKISKKKKSKTDWN